MRLLALALIIAACSGSSMPSVDDADTRTDALGTLPDAGAASDAQNQGSDAQPDAFVPDPGMVYVPSGPFMMGCAPSDQNCRADESPAHEVTLSAFEIDRTEVTQEQYRACKVAGACSATWPLPAGSIGDQKPAANVSYQQATNYCAWSGKRLPTEAEWEKAARGTDSRIYAWGDAAPDCTTTNLEVDDIACQSGICCGGYYTGVLSVVGAYPQDVGPYGTVDMGGNVAEWVSDWYGPYSAESASDPTGPPTGTLRLIRGGSFAATADRVRTSSRAYASEGSWDWMIGLRCAKDIP